MRGDDGEDGDGGVGGDACSGCGECRGSECGGSSCGDELDDRLGALIVLESRGASSFTADCSASCSGTSEAAADISSRAGIGTELITRKVTAFSLFQRSGLESSSIVVAGRQGQLRRAWASANGSR